MEPPPEATPAIGPVPDSLAEAWDAAKNGRNVSNIGRALDAVGAPSGSSFLFRYTLILEFRRHI